MSRRIWPPIFLVIVVLSIQMAAIERPYLGHFSSYQLVMASMARNMVREDFTDLLLPKVDMLLNGKKALHLNQYPFPSVLAALGVRNFGGSFEFWGRVQAIFLNLLSALFLALIALRLFDKRTGLTAFFIYLLSPFTLIYGQCFMSEPLSFFCFLGAVYFSLGKRDAEGVAFLSLIFPAFLFSIALTGRIHFIILLPLFMARIFFCRNSHKILKVGLFTFIALAMPVIWCIATWFISADSDHVVTNVFLQFTGRKIADQNYLTHLDYYRHLLDVFSLTMLTPLLFPFSVIGFGLMSKRSEGFWMTAGGLLLSLSIIVLAPQKVMAHDFYLYTTFPFLVLLTAFGLAQVLNFSPSLNTRRAVFFLFLVYFAVSSRYFLHPLFTPAPGELRMFQVAQSIREKTKPEDSLIVAAENAPVFAYYVDRPTFLMGLGQLGKELPYYLKNQSATQSLQEVLNNPIGWFQLLKEQGAAYFVIPDKREAVRIEALVDFLDKNYLRVSSAQDDFYLFSLKSPLKD